MSKYDKELARNLVIQGKMQRRDYVVAQLTGQAIAPYFKYNFIPDPSKVERHNFTVRKHYDKAAENVSRMNLQNFDVTYDKHLFKNAIIESQFRNRNAGVAYATTMLFAPLYSERTHIRERRYQLPTRTKLEIEKEFGSATDL